MVADMPIMGGHIKGGQGEVQPPWPLTLKCCLSWNYTLKFSFFIKKHFWTIYEVKFALKIKKKILLKHGLIFKII